MEESLVDLGENDRDECRLEIAELEPDEHGE